MHNRLLALLLTALMVWTLAVPALGANPFFDVPEDHWAYDAVEYLAEAGLIEGYPDGTFGGARNFTRYEMALVFARIVARFGSTSISWFRGSHPFAGYREPVGRVDSVWKASTASRP